MVVLPTPVNLASYTVAPFPRGGPCAWRGSARQQPLLPRELTPVLRRLGDEGVGYEIHVVSDRLPDMPGVPCRLVRWSEAAEGHGARRLRRRARPAVRRRVDEGQGRLQVHPVRGRRATRVASAVGANVRWSATASPGLWAPSRRTVARGAPPPVRRRHPSAADGRGGPSARRRTTSRGSGHATSRCCSTPRRRRAGPANAWNPPCGSDPVCGPERHLVEAAGPAAPPELLALAPALPAEHPFASSGR